MSGEVPRKSGVNDYKNRNVARLNDSPRREIDRLWKALRILKVQITELRSGFDAVERKANRIAVTESRSKAKLPAEKSRELKAGDIVRKGE